MVLDKIQQSIFKEESPEGHEGVEILQAILLNAEEQSSDRLYYTYACNWLVTTCICWLENSSHIQTARECEKWTQENKYTVCVVTITLYSGTNLKNTVKKKKKTFRVKKKGKIDDNILPSILVSVCRLFSSLIRKFRKKKAPDSYREWCFKYLKNIKYSTSACRRLCVSRWLPASSRRGCFPPLVSDSRSIFFQIPFGFSLVHRKPPGINGNLILSPFQINREQHTRSWLNLAKIML